MTDTSRRISPVKIFQATAEGDYLNPRTDIGFNALVDLADLQFNHCVELDNEDSQKTAEKSEAIREWWQVVNTLLLVFVRIKAQEDRYPEPAPWTTLARLANIAEELSSGNVPSFVRDAAGAGKARPFWRMEKRAIGYAVLYIEAAERGEINDRRAKSTVREIFGVSAETVRNWLKRRDEMVTGIPNGHKLPRMLVRHLQEHGEIYSRVGRSTMKPQRKQE